MCILLHFYCKLEVKHVKYEEIPYYVMVVTVLFRISKLQKLKMVVLSLRPKILSFLKFINERDQLMLLDV